MEQILYELRKLMNQNEEMVDELRKLRSQNMDMTEKMQYVTAQNEQLNMQVQQLSMQIQQMTLLTMANCGYIDQKDRELAWESYKKSIPNHSPSYNHNYEMNDNSKSFM